MIKMYCLIFLCSLLFGSSGTAVVAKGVAERPDGLFFCQPKIVTTATPDGKIADMPVMSPSDLPGAVISRSEIYVGGSLWGLINGAADLYYEYGFDRMALQDIGWEGENFRLELYRMDSPLAAYGIFSVSVHGCEEGGPVSTGYCINRFQYQLYSGNYYLSLINYSGSDKARELSLKIAELVANRTGGAAAVLPGLFVRQPFEVNADGIRLIRGIIGVRNIVPGIAHLFDEADDFEIWHLGIASDSGQQEILLLKSPGPHPLPEAAAITEGLSMAGYAVREADGQVVAVMSDDFVESNELLDRIIILL